MARVGPTWCERAVQIYRITSVVQRACFDSPCELPRMLPSLCDPSDLPQQPPLLPVTNAEIVGFIRQFIPYGYYTTMKPQTGS